MGGETSGPGSKSARGEDKSRGLSVMLLGEERGEGGCGRTPRLTRLALSERGHPSPTSVEGERNSQTGTGDGDRPML